MDFTQYVLLAAVIAGVVQLISHLRAKDYWGAGTVACAAIIGGLFGAFHYDLLPDVATGIAAGFGAVGAITALSKLGVTSPSVTPNTSLVSKDQSRGN